MLILSFCLPPLKYPRSIQIGRLIKNLPFKPNVIYADEKNNLDFSILEHFDQYVNIKIQIPFRTYNKYISYFKRKFLPFIYQVPDIQRFWSYKLYKKAKETIQTTNEDLIITFGQPMSVHLAGLKLKKENPKLKWIAHFSDPWVDNPLNHQTFLIKKFNSKLERDVFKHADKIIFTSLETIDLIKRNYAPDIHTKMRYLPHSYEKEYYDYSLKNESNKFLIRYIGGFYSERSPKPLFEAMDILHKNYNYLLTNVQFEIIGDLGKHSTLASHYQHLKNHLSFISSVPYQMSLTYMQTSDVLLVIDAPNDKSIFFPSKLVDYIGSQKPIIGITPLGTSERIIKKLNGLTANPDNLNEIVSMLINVLSHKNEYKKFPSNSNYLEYEAKQITNQFLAIVNET